MINLPTVGLNEFSRRTIQEYGNKDRNLDYYIFAIFTKRMNEEEDAVGNFIPFVNQHMKAIAKAVGATVEVSTYWARHMFTFFPS